MRKSLFRIAKMDCPAEEQLIRSALAGTPNVASLEFDLGQHQLGIWHSGEVAALVTQLVALELGAELVSSQADQAAPTTPRDQTKVLQLLLVINAVMFLVEGAAGWLWESTGLLSDSLDMLADAMVYGVAIWAARKAGSSQALAARLAGWVELALAFGVLAQVARHALVGSEPLGTMMIATSALALAANVACLVALAKHRDGGVHMRASWIFSTNDVIANLGVIAAGALVLLTSSALPDLVIGTVIGLIVLRGALRILTISDSTPPST